MTVLKNKFFSTAMYVVALLMFFYLAVYPLEDAGVFKQHSWIDIPIHFICGFLVAGLWTSFQIYFLMKRYNFLHTLCMVLLIGVLWEVIEAIPLIGEGWAGYPEAIKDVCVDLLGMLIFHGVTGRHQKGPS